MERRIHKSLKRTSRAEISLTNMFTDTLKPTRLETLEAAVAIDELLPAHIDGTIAVSQHNAASAAEQQGTYEDEE
jgi:hypothetical protein